VHEADEPNSVLDLFYSDRLAGKDLAEIDLLTSQANSAAGGDGDGFVVERIFAEAGATAASPRSPSPTSPCTPSPSRDAPFTPLAISFAVRGLWSEKIARTAAEGYNFARNSGS
jgi:hypothetical protein